MTDARALVAGIGNVFLGDDAFGVEVVAALAKQELPVSVRVMDFGIRGVDLAFALLEGYDTVILVDALPRGGAPGQVYVVEIELDEQAPSLDRPAPLLDMHRLDPAKVLRLVRAMGGRLGRLLVVGCEPAPLDETAHARPGLSDAARAAIPVAVQTIRQLVAQWNGSERAASYDVERATI